MSHSVSITMTADQEIDIQGRKVNIHDIRSIVVNGDGVITDAYLAPELTEVYIGWLSQENDICKTCGAHKANYREMMQEECWHGH